MVHPGGVESGSLTETLVREFEELDLSPYASRVLVTLLRVGSANSAELARLCGVPRTSTYQIIEELSRKGLAERLAIEGPATWVSPGREAVLERLDALHDERLREQRARTVRIRELLATTLPDGPMMTAEPYVHVLVGASQVVGSYDRLVSEAESELLVFNRPPYSQSPDQVNPVVLDALARGVDTRALYVANQWFDEEGDSFRAAMERYHAAGVRGACVPDLPFKLAVADRRVALLAVTDLPVAGFPTTLLIEHPGFAGVQARAFDGYWAEAVLIAGP
jgi:sugar-specific transcriptional regulator TrmB